MCRSSFAFLMLCGFFGSMCTGATNKELPGMWHRCEAASTSRAEATCLVRHFLL